MTVENTLRIFFYVGYVILIRSLQFLNEIIPVIMN